MRRCSLPRLEKISSLGFRASASRFMERHSARRSILGPAALDLSALRWVHVAVARASLLVEEGLASRAVVVTSLIAHALTHTSAALQEWLVTTAYSVTLASASFFLEREAFFAV